MTTKGLAGKKSVIMKEKTKLWFRNFTTWDAEEVLGVLQGMIDRLEADEDEEIYTLGRLFVLERIPVQYCSEWRHKWRENRKIVDKLNTIRDIIEDRINRGGMSKRFSVKMVRFNLLNHFSHRWTQVNNIHIGKSQEDKIKEKTEAILQEIIQTGEDGDDT